RRSPSDGKEGYNRAPMRLTILLSLVLGCSPSGPCAGVSGNCVSFTKSNKEADVQTAVAQAKANTTFLFGAGTYTFANELNFTVDNVTIKGAGMDQTVFDFTNQTAGAEGVLSMNNGFTMSDLTVRNPKGDGIKTVGSTGVTFERVHVIWDNPDLSTH